MMGLPPFPLSVELLGLGLGSPGLGSVGAADFLLGMSETIYQVAARKSGSSAQRSSRYAEVSLVRKTSTPAPGEMPVSRGLSTSQPGVPRTGDPQRGD
jgi:hypothetical protein